MRNQNVRLRCAVRNDAGALAELINFAGEGMPYYLWEAMAEPGETAWDVGQRRAQREEGSFSFRNGVVAEFDGEIAGCLVGYPLAKDFTPIDYDNTPPMFVPLQELESLAPDTWYVNVLAVYPQFRGRGIGTELLREAETMAKEAGNCGLSIIVSDGNINAERLYERCGYTRKATRSMVKERWENPGTNWVLMLKPSSQK